jgi:hypothetical protein
MCGMCRRPEGNAYAAGHQFVFRVNFSTSGEGTIPADRVHVTIPKSILTKRDGTKGDTMELSRSV